MLISDILKLPVLHRSPAPDSLLDDLVDQRGRDESADISDLFYELLASTAPDDQGNWCREIAALRWRGKILAVTVRDGKYGDEWYTAVLDAHGYLMLYEHLVAKPALPAVPSNLNLSHTYLEILHAAGVSDSRKPSDIRGIQDLAEYLILRGLRRGINLTIMGDASGYLAAPKDFVREEVSHLPYVTVKDAPGSNSCYLTVQPPEG